MDTSEDFLWLAAKAHARVSRSGLCHASILPLRLQERGAGEDEQQWALSRFTPLLQDVLEDMAANRLSTDEFPYVRPPSADPCESGPQLKGTYLQMPCGVYATCRDFSACSPSSNLCGPAQLLLQTSAAVETASW